MKKKKYFFIIVILLILLSALQNKAYAYDNEQKNKDNGVYRIAVGKKPEKVIEIQGGEKTDGAIVDIWNYRKCITTKVLFRISKRWVL